MSDAERIAAALGPLRLDPLRSAVLTDFDGTISPIVADPAAARPVEGAVQVLHGLARRYARVAVVSGRPASFLADRLDLASRSSGLVAVGLYGLEETDGSGPVRTIPLIEPWRPVVAEAATRAEASVPGGVTVERKGASVTLHWRRAPEAGPEAAAIARVIATELGLELRPGRKSVELTPPVGVDKGVAVEELCRGLAGALFVGDDLGDLAAFRALERASAATGMWAVRGAVVSDEAPPELLAAADLVLAGPTGVVAMLETL